MKPSAVKYEYQTLWKLYNFFQQVVFYNVVVILHYIIHYQRQQVVEQIIGIKWNTPKPELIYIFLLILSLNSTFGLFNSYSQEHIRNSSVIVLVHCLVCISHKITTPAKTNIPAKHYRVYHIVKYVCSAKTTQIISPFTNYNPRKF